MTTILFAHGKESGPWGSKIRYLADIAWRLGAHVISPDYSDLPSPEDRVARLLALPRFEHETLILVGSSMGGYVSTLASHALKPKGLFLMAPAMYMPGYAEQRPMSGATHTCVVFGRQDDVIPVDNGIRFAAENHADLHVIEGDHRLNDQIVKVGELFEAFLRKLEVGQWWDSLGFQTPETLTAIARPFIGKVFHRGFASFDRTKDLKWTPRQRELDACRDGTDYGDVQVAFREGGDLTLTIDLKRDGMGGPPVAGLRLNDRSIPQLYADSDVSSTNYRFYCRYFPLQWQELVIQGLMSEQRRDVLREVWLMTGTFPGIEGAIPLICGIALKFVCESGQESQETTNFLGVSFNPNDEDSWRQTWVCQELPEPVPGSDWQRALG